MRYFKNLLFFIHIIIVVALLGTTLNAYISPKQFSGLNLLSLAFPILLISHIIICFIWIILKNKRIFIFLILSLILINPIKRWVNYSSLVKEEPNLSILSFNIRNNELEDRNAAQDYLDTQKADIVLLQEAGKYKDNRPDLNKPYQTNYWRLLSIQSKYKIIKQDVLFDDRYETGNAQYADIDINGKIIRIVNVYLNPFFFDKKEIIPNKDFNQNEQKTKFIVKRLLETFSIHQNQVDRINSFISKSPYPIILTGDFNSVPNSYEYYTLLGNLNDAFVEVGKGSATSFHDYKFPIRIDYIFTSKNIKPISYKVDRSVHFSDHFPVKASFKIKD